MISAFQSSLYLLKEIRGKQKNLIIATVNLPFADAGEIQSTLFSYLCQFQKKVNIVYLKEPHEMDRRSILKRLFQSFSTVPEQMEGIYY